MEGYFLYCFFALLVTNLGGPAGTIAKLQTSETQFCCNRYFYSGENDIDSKRLCYMKYILTLQYCKESSNIVVVCIL